MESYNLIETTDDVPERTRRSTLHVARQTISRATIKIQSALLDPSDGTETALEARTHIAKGIYPFVGFSLMFTVLIAVPLVGAFASGPWVQRYWRPLTAPVIGICAVCSFISG